MKIDTFQCDGCTTMRGASNHWWLASVVQADHFNVFPWSERRLKESPIELKHYCGRECLRKAQERWMGTCGNGSSDDQGDTGRVGGLAAKGATGYPKLA